MPFLKGLCDTVIESDCDKVEVYLGKPQIRTKSCIYGDSPISTSSPISGCLILLLLFTSIVLSFLLLSLASPSTSLITDS